MRKDKLVTILALLLCFGCSTKTFDTTTSKELQKNFGKITANQRNSGILWNDFVSNKNKYVTASIEIINYTEEGDPIITTLKKDTMGYTLTMDSSKDRFHGNRDPISSKTFKYLHKMDEKEYENMIHSFDVNRSNCYSEDSTLFDYWILSDYPKYEIIESTYADNVNTTISDPTIVFTNKISN